MRNVRTAVYVLLFVNLVFMAWAHWIDVPAEPPVNQADGRLPRLVLASEAPARAPAAPKAVLPQAAPLAIEGPAPALTAATRRCVSVGPFNDLAQQTRAAALLQERGFVPQQRTEDGDVRDGFWVYVGGIKSAADETCAPCRTRASAMLVPWLPRMTAGVCRLASSRSGRARRSAHGSLSI